MLLFKPSSVKPRDIYLVWSLGAERKAYPEGYADKETFLAAKQLLNSKELGVNKMSFIDLILILLYHTDRGRRYE